jgi:transposase
MFEREACAKESCVARVYDVTDTTLQSWIKHFHEDRERLKAPANRHRKSILNDDDRAVISGLIYMTCFESAFVNAMNSLIFE